MRGGELSQHRALTTFPRVEAAGNEQVKRLPRPAAEVEQGGESHRTVVAAQDQFTTLFEKRETGGGLVVALGAQLVVFGNEARVRRIKFHCPEIVPVRLGGVAVEVPQPDAEVSEHGGEPRAFIHRALPAADRIGVALAVVEQVAKPVSRHRIGTWSVHRPLEDDLFVKPRGEEVIRRLPPCLGQQGVVAFQPGKHVGG